MENLKKWCDSEYGDYKIEVLYKYLQENRLIHDLIERGIFSLDEKHLRRAGLDYWPMVDLRVYDGLEQFFTEHPAPDLWLATTKAPRSYDQAQFRDGCYLFFGKETAGLPLGFREEYRERCIRIPMRPDARSLNLANSVAVVAYEALRQLGFPGLSGQGEMAEGL